MDPDLHGSLKMLLFTLGNINPLSNVQSDVNNDIKTLTKKVFCYSIELNRTLISDFIYLLKF